MEAIVSEGCSYRREGSAHTIEVTPWGSGVREGKLSISFICPLRCKINRHVMFYLLIWPCFFGLKQCPVFNPESCMLDGVLGVCWGLTSPQLEPGTPICQAPHLKSTGSELLMWPAWSLPGSGQVAPGGGGRWMPLRHPGVLALELTRVLGCSNTLPFKFTSLGNLQASLWREGGRQCTAVVL